MGRAVPTAAATYTSLYRFWRQHRELLEQISHSGTAPRISGALITTKGRQE
jgi:hypothetical protein